MVVGSVHLVEFVELWFWLGELGYTGWYSMDQYPYREDGQGALRASVEFLAFVDKVLTAEARAELRAVVAGGDALAGAAWIRRRVLRRS